MSDPALPVAAHQAHLTHPQCPAEGVFTGYHAYTNALEYIVGSASQLVSVFDHDINQSRLENFAIASALEALCQKSAHTPCIRILLRCARNFYHEAPRLLQLMRGYSNLIEIRLINEGMVPGRYTESPFIIGDQQKIAIRFHHDGPRGKYSATSTPETGRLLSRFEECWDKATHGPSLTVLGL